ncbi:YwqJ-related putative deaminase [Vibrio aerogenes]|uniref:YwqJ-related putative deaminase n=1 Tax=Vibrio aerogenes TaxID=92172 RepID=UPI0029057123|nr:YwqJ-related putative deaminase [Vibrio aerogenes]
MFIGDTPYKGETFDCGKDSAQEKSTFLKITPLAEAADAIWTCPPFIDEPIRKVVKGEEQAVEVGQVSATRTEAANDLNALVEKDAQELISKNKTSGVAVSRAGIPEEGIISEPFENIPFSLKKGRTFPGTERCGDNKELIKITNQREYMDELSALYAKSGNRLNPVMESKIKEHVKEGAIFGLRDDKGLKGIPGLHAEVQAANNVLNKASAKPGFDVSKVQVSTFKTQNSFGQGKEFIACNHCSGILNGFDILTGH